MHLRLLAVPQEGRLCDVRRARTQSRPAQLDWAKLAAMGVKRPALTRRLTVLRASFAAPTDAA
jgi:hypothetical protein